MIKSILIVMYLPTYINVVQYKNSILSHYTTETEHSYFTQKSLSGVTSFSNKMFGGSSSTSGLLTIQFQTLLSQDAMLMILIELIDDRYYAVWQIAGKN